MGSGVRSGAGVVRDGVRGAFMGGVRVRGQVRGGGRIRGQVRSGVGSGSGVSSWAGSGVRSGAGSGVWSGVRSAHAGGSGTHVGAEVEELVELARPVQVRLPGQRDVGQVLLDGQDVATPAAAHARTRQHHFPARYPQILSVDRYQTLSRDLVLVNR